MKNSIQKGFTLIELLVVIAIIGILAGILFVTINPAEKISEASDVQKKASLAGISSEATIIYTNNNYDYNTVCQSPAIVNLEAKYDTTTNYGSGNFICHDDDDEYAAQILLGPGRYYCIDSTGFRGETTNSKGISRSCNTD